MYARLSKSAPREPEGCAILGFFGVDILMMFCAMSPLNVDPAIDTATEGEAATCGVFDRQYNSRFLVTTSANESTLAVILAWQLAQTRIRLSVSLLLGLSSM